ncbi:hypothetical protein J7M28_07475 [bacterium]|nr:hypothetical protein [bacterium]
MRDLSGVRGDNPILDERSLQVLFARFPKIVESQLNARRIPVSGLELYRCEDVCDSGRVDLAFRERSGKRIVLIELQLGLADKDHHDRLAGYVLDYTDRLGASNVIGAHFAERFPAGLPRYMPPLYRSRYTISSMLRRAAALEFRDEEIFGLCSPKPPVDAFARLSYLNGFFAFMGRGNHTTLRQIINNIPNIVKNPRQIRNPEYRARLFVRFGKSFGLLEQKDGVVRLTSLGMSYSESVDRSFLWSLNQTQRRLLIAGIAGARCTNGHKFGMFCLLKAVDEADAASPGSREQLLASFVSLCSAEMRWSPGSRKASFGWYLEYSSELLLLERRMRSDEAPFLTPIGRELMALLSRQYAAFDMERRLVLGSSRHPF